MTLTVAALQMVSTPDVARNLDAAEQLLIDARAAGAQLAVLPEYFCLLGHQDTDKLGVAEELGDGPIQRRLQQLARTLGLWIVGGTLPLRVPGRDDRVTNSSLVFGPDGLCHARYDKIHLFAFDNGRERFDESRVLLAGDRPMGLVVDIGGESWSVGLSICYDLRFPELYRHLAARPPGCDLLCVPSAFTHTTGQAHWELLLRARAVENQCYVVAPAQGGLHENGRRTWGHTLVVDAWGRVLAVRPEGAGVVFAQLQRAHLAEVRNRLPALAHRRL
jgi:nitrilase